MSVSRRQVLAGGAVFSAMSVLRLSWANGAVASDGFGPLAPLAARNTGETLLALPEGFSYTAFGKTGEPMVGLDGRAWGPTPGAHDGMAAYAGPRGTTLLVRNHELGISSTDNGLPIPLAQRYDPGRPNARGVAQYVRGGTTNLVVDRDGTLLATYPSLGGTIRNCAGGPTPWGSWLTCEETNTFETSTGAAKRHGYVFEVPSTATGPVAPVPLVAMGRFSHEAVAVDPESGHVYLTEDEGDSALYRFRPAELGSLAAGGVLEAMKLVALPGVDTASGFPVGQPFEVEWVPVANANPGPGQTTTRAQAQALGAAIVRRGEGCWWSRNDDAVFVVSTSGGDAGQGQVFRYAPRAGAGRGGVVELFIESEGDDQSSPRLWQLPDNITVAPWGDLVICEDGDGQQNLWIVSKERGVFRFAANLINEAEFAGACFAPNGRTLFVNIQTPGVTFAITGPFRPLHSTRGY
jgi:secreted PhoX family phosphatase